VASVYRFLLMLLNGEAADPPAFLTEEPEWNPGDVFVASNGRAFRIVATDAEVEVAGMVLFDGIWTIEPLDDRTAGPVVERPCYGSASGEALSRAGFTLGFRNAARIMWRKVAQVVNSRASPNPVCGVTSAENENTCRPSASNENKATPAHQPGPFSTPRTPNANPTSTETRASAAAPEPLSSTHVLMSVAQSASSTPPPRGTVRVTSWTPVKVVLALSQETVANGSRKQSAISAKRVGESHRLLAEPSFRARASHGAPPSRPRNLIESLLRPSVSPQNEQVDGRRRGRCRAV
jgi:hypothetical protein